MEYYLPSHSCSHVLRFFNTSTGHKSRALLTIIRMSKCLLWSLNLLQNRTRKMSTITKSIYKIIFPLEIIRKRLLFILIIYSMSLRHVIITWCWEISRNFIMNPIYNYFSIVKCYHLYICSFQLQYFNLSHVFSFLFLLYA